MAQAGAIDIRLCNKVGKHDPSGSIRFRTPDGHVVEMGNIKNGKCSDYWPARKGAIVHVFIAVHDPDGVKHIGRFKAKGPGKVTVNVLRGGKYLVG